MSYKDEDHHPGVAPQSSPKNQSTFLLSKWYLDCVARDGSAFIGYAASLRWKGLSLNYSSRLQYRPGERSEIEATLQEFSVPEITDQSIQWASSRLGVEGLWEATAPPISQTLLKSAQGDITWECLHPRARAEVRLRNGQGLEGLGYAEHLTMTIPPWRLPFAELRWGRFLSGEDALVWVNWRGRESLNLSFHNGICIENARLTDKGIEADELNLTFEESHILREGPLVETALSVIPGIHRLFPFRILRAHERKWLSRGLLRRPNAGESAGWAIHEVVRWPGQSSPTG